MSCEILSVQWFFLIQQLFSPSNPSGQFSKGSAFLKSTLVYPVGYACHSLPSPISTTTSIPISRVSLTGPRRSFQFATVDDTRKAAHAVAASEGDPFPNRSQRSIILQLLSSSILPGRFKSTRPPGASIDSWVRSQVDGREQTIFAKPLDPFHLQDRGSEPPKISTKFTVYSSMGPKRGSNPSEVAAQTHEIYPDVTHTVPPQPARQRSLAGTGAFLPGEPTDSRARAHGEAGYHQKNGIGAGWGGSGHGICLTLYAPAGPAEDDVPFWGRAENGPPRPRPRLYTDSTSSTYLPGAGGLCLTAMSLAKPWRYCPPGPASQPSEDCPAPWRPSPPILARAMDGGD
jgi:hypothetical protein